MSDACSDACGMWRGESKLGDARPLISRLFASAWALLGFLLPSMATRSSAQMSTTLLWQGPEQTRGHARPALLAASGPLSSAPLELPL